MHIVIIGAGGIGGYYGARLQAQGQRVTFIARGAYSVPAIGASSAIHAYRLSPSALGGD